MRRGRGCSNAGTCVVRLPLPYCHSREMFACNHRRAPRRGPSAATGISPWLDHRPSHLCAKYSLVTVSVHVRPFADPKSKTHVAKAKCTANLPATNNPTKLMHASISLALRPLGFSIHNRCTRARQAVIVRLCVPIHGLLPLELPQPSCLGLISASHAWL